MKLYNYLKTIPNHIWYLLSGLAIGLLATYLTIYVIGFDITSYTIGWNDIDSKIFLVLPFVLLLIVFLTRKTLSNTSTNNKDILLITLGLIAFFWELNHDLNTIHNRTIESLNYTVYTEFVRGFSLCRMNTYIVGVFLMFRRTEMLKWVAATSFFGGIVSIVGEYHGTANTHSLITHSVILTVFPAIGITLTKSNYTMRNLIHAFIFNLTLVAIMMIVNYSVNNGWDVVKVPHKVHSIAGELTRTNMGDNALVDFLPWPFNMVLWITAVMIVEVIYCFTQRLIVWRTYKKDKTIREIYSAEFKIDKKEWYGLNLRKR